MDILNSDATMSKLLSETKIVKCKRQLPNLKRMLIKSDFNETKTSAKVTRCNEPRCGLCEHIVEGSSIFLGNKTFHVKENMDCTVQNVLYVLSATVVKNFTSDRRGTNYEIDGLFTTSK